MTYQEFQTSIQEELTNKLPSTTHLELKTIMKNNGTNLTGLLITSEHCNIAPTIYLDYYFDQYKNGASIDDIIHELLQCYEHNKPEDNFDISFFTNYEQVKNKIIYKLINYNKNKDLLENVPHIPYLDLAIVFCCLTDFREENDGSILIHNSHMDFWGINRDDLLSLATSNTPHLLNANIRDIKDVVEELMPGEMDDTLEDDEADMIPHMYVLTNGKKLNGACCILYQDFLLDFASQQNCDFFIIPSSIHEVLLIPAKDITQRDSLTQMVQEVNASQVADDEILSDHVYFYSKDLNTITC